MNNFFIIIEYLILMISVFCIFNARSIISKKVDFSKKNRYVQSVKKISTALACAMMFLIIYF